MTEHESMIARYRELKLAGWALCHRWRLERLAEKLAAHDTACGGTVTITTTQESELQEESQPEPETQPAPMSVVVTQQEPVPLCLEEWEAISEVFRQQPEGDEHPLAMSVGFVPYNLRRAGEFMIADGDSPWVTMNYIPSGFWQGDLSGRCVMQFRHTSFRYGVPGIREGDAYCTFDCAKQPSWQPQEDELDLSDARVVNIANRLMWAVISTGFVFRRTWQNRIERFLRFLSLGLPYSANRKFCAWRKEVQAQRGFFPGHREQAENCILLGGNRPYRQGILRDRAAIWPEPLLAFPASLLPTLYERVFTQELGRSARRRVSVAPYGTVNAFTEEIVRHKAVPICSSVEGELVTISTMKEGDVPVYSLSFETLGGRRAIQVTAEAELRVEPGDYVVPGQLIGAERIPLREAFFQMPHSQKIKYLRVEFGEIFELLLRQWFDRSCLHLRSGYVHVPFMLGCNAAQLSEPEHMLWRLDKSLPLYDEEVEAFILTTCPEFPAGVVESWVGDQTFEFPHAFLSVDDSRFMNPPTSWWGRDDGYRKVNKDKKEAEEELEVELADQDVTELHPPEPVPAGQPEIMTEI